MKSFTIRSAAFFVLLTAGLPAAFSPRAEAGVAAMGPYSGDITSNSVAAANQTKAGSGPGYIQDIVVNGGTLAFGDVITNKTTLSQSYTVSGSNLTTNVTVTAPAGFLVSASSASGFGPSLTLTQSGGTMAPTPVYVRFNPTAVRAYSGNITNSSAGFADGLQAVTGNGVARLIALVSMAGDIVYATNVNGKAYNVHMFRWC